VSDGLIKTPDGKTLISSNNINQVLNVFIPRDNSIKSLTFFTDSL